MELPLQAVYSSVWSNVWPSVVDVRSSFLFAFCFCPLLSSLTLQGQIARRRVLTLYCRDYDWEDDDVGVVRRGDTSNQDIPVMVTITGSFSEYSHHLGEMETVSTHD